MIGEMHNMIRVILISGSTAHPAHTAALIQDIADRLQVRNCSVTIWDLQKRPLPVVNPLL